VPEDCLLGPFRSIAGRHRKRRVERDIGGVDRGERREISVARSAQLERRRVYPQTGKRPQPEVH
jgi:hypothetical protein